MVMTKKFTVQVNVEKIAQHDCFFRYNYSMSRVKRATFVGFSQNVYF